MAHIPDQSPSTVIMIRPANFGFDPETAESNAFQTKPELSEKELQAKVLQEFDESVEKIRQSGVNVVVFQDRKEPICPDAVFPNNWFSAHHEGLIFIYPMFPKSRRFEIRQDVIDHLKTLRNYEVVDLSHFAKQDKALEGTGSIVFDYIKRVAYVCRSSRTNEEVLSIVCEKLGGYRSVVFDSQDNSGVLFYHTNVMMWIGTKLIAVCLDSIKNQKELELVKRNLDESGRKVIVLSQEEVGSFAGNCIELSNAEGHLILVASKRAMAGLSQENKQAINESFDKVVVCDVSNIENVGGGGIRCMIAGVHLK